MRNGWGRFVGLAYERVVGALEMHCVRVRTRRMDGNMVGMLVE